MGWSVVSQFAKRVYCDAVHSLPVLGCGDCDDTGSEFNCFELEQKKYTWCLTNIYLPRTNSEKQLRQYGDIHPITFPEYVFVTVAIFTGATFYAVIIAAVGGHVVSSRFAAKTEYNRYLDAMIAFERFNNLPLQVRERIDVYCDHIWKRRKSFLEDKIQEKLPIELRNAINEAIHAKVVKRSKLLSACDSHGFLKRFAQLIQPVGMCVPDEILFCEGGVIEKLYFCHRGRIDLSVRIENENQDLIIASRTDGQYCGDMGLFPPEAFNPETEYKHECTGVASAFCDVYYVNAKDLRILLQGFPREAEMFTRVAQERKAAADELLAAYDILPVSAQDLVIEKSWLTDLTIKLSLAEKSPSSWADTWLEAISPDTDNILISKIIAMPVRSFLRFLWGGGAR